MRNQRLMDHVVRLLEIANHPEIAAVEFYDSETTNVQKGGFDVKMKNGSTVRFRCVGTYPPGGDDHSQPEKIPYPEYEIPIEEVRNVPSLRSVRGRQG